MPVGAQAKHMMGKREQHQLQRKRSHRRSLSKSEMRKERLFSEYPLGTSGVVGVGATMSVVLASVAYWIVNIAEPQAAGIV